MKVHIQQASPVTNSPQPPQLQEKDKGITMGVGGTGIPKPTAAIKGTSKPPREEQRSMPQTPVKSPPSIGREGSSVGCIVPSSVNGGKQAVAMVSPMPSEPLSESSNSASTGLQSNSSESSSVIYKPTSTSDSGSEIYPPPPPPPPNQQLPTPPPLPNQHKTLDGQKVIIIIIPKIIFLRKDIDFLLGL